MRILLVCLGVLACLGVSAAAVDEKGIEYYAILVDGGKIGHMIQTRSVENSMVTTIQEMNTVRKHLSSVKGGRLLERIAPARAMTVIISDVVGDDLASIGSGPTTADPTTYADCMEILRRYALTDPRRVYRRRTRYPGHVSRRGILQGV